jgi:hypothetical protein
MNRIIKWVEDTGFKVSTEKINAIMFSRRKFPITTRPRMNIWAKGEKIEQVKQNRILGLTFDTKMNWLERKKMYNKMSATYHMGSRPRKHIESTPNDNPRYTEIRRRSIQISYIMSAEEVRIRTDPQ